MDASNKRKHAGLPAKYVIAACLAVIAGFATVYLSFAPSDNGSGPVLAPETPAKPAGPVAEIINQSPLVGLNKGAMAAFVVRPKPLDLPDLAFEGPDGTKKTLSDLKGKVLLLNIWATWCVPCRQEFPDLVHLERAYRGRGLAVLGISTDLSKDLPAVETFLAATKPGFPNYRKKSGGDDQDFIESVDSKWGGELPFSVLYGRDGKKAEVFSGKQTYADFEKAVVKLLKEAGAAGSPTPPDSP